MKEAAPESFHRWHADAVKELLDVRVEAGLNVAEVRKRQRKYGPNRLSRARRESGVKRFLLQYVQHVMYLW